MTTSCLSNADPAYLASFKCISGPATFSSLISSQLLLPATQAAATPQRIVVDGLITNDISGVSGYTFAAGSEIIFASVGSGFIVDVNNQLTLDNTILQGCQSMWRSIKVKPNGRLIVKNNCEIRDALFAIEAEHSAYISIVNSKFKQNNYAVFLGQNTVGNQQGTVYFTSGGGIWGNDFAGGNLKAPYLGLQATAGIGCLNLTSLVIGSETQNNNIFHDFQSSGGAPCGGIVLDKSNATVTASQFINLGLPILGINSRNSDAAISAFGNSKLTMTGLGFGNSSITIEGGNTGIYLQNSSADISDAWFSRNPKSVIYENGTAKNATNFLRVQSTGFESFVLAGIYASFNGSLGLSEVFVSECMFDDNSSNPQSRHHIFLRSGFKINSENYKFINNQFVYSESPQGVIPGVSSTCIHLENLEKGTASLNSFEAADIPSSFFRGGYMSGCSQFKWNDNSFNGMNAGADEKGLEVDESPLCQYRCNSFNNIKIGAHFLGNCDFSELSKNVFTGNALFGLLIGDAGFPLGGNAKIGAQNWRKNRWDNAGAKLDFGTFTGSPMLLSAVLNSQFKIHDANQSSDYWASPRNIGTYDDEAAPLWFKFIPSGGVSSDYCVPEEYANPNNDLGDVAFSILNGSYTPYQGLVADTWEASFNLFAHLTHNPSLLTSGSQQLAWYNARYNEPLGKLARAYEAYVNLTDDASNAAAQQILYDVALIPTAGIYEQNLKTCLTLFLENYLSPTRVFTAVQLSSLNAIAAQCRWEGAFGVLLARSALGQSTTQVNDCNFNLLERGGLKLQNSIGIKIFPNPSLGELNLISDTRLANGMIRLRDLNGRLIQSWNVTGNEVQVTSTQDLTGVYLLEIWESNNILTRQKLVFLK